MRMIGDTEYKSWLADIWNAKKGKFWVGENSYAPDNKIRLREVLQKLYLNNGTVEEAIDAIDELEKSF